MPELPEVETTIRELNKNRAFKVLNARFIDVWTDSPKLIKKPKSFKFFKEKIKNKKIKKIWRKGKNIVFTLSDNFYLLIHQKLSGHLLAGKWTREDSQWRPKNPKYLKDRVNTYIHLMFFLNNGGMIALSDLRKFAKVELLKRPEIEKELSAIGIDPLEKGFTFSKFQEALKNKKGEIKKVLMNQQTIAGIGNIYSDEILWEAKINPLRKACNLSKKELKTLYLATKTILKKAIKTKGSSVVDYRRISGEKGGFEKILKVYRKEGQKCPRCGAIIKKTKIGGRTAHYCPNCQK
ncbi:MAG TPA: DNA-formamidopyrimidine glycosylase [Candidatus Parcubacteria bacterium]|nr:DNA-formamidopyrimidine glycosylase [Candidatus Parcubacteria bacterium]